MMKFYATVPPGIEDIASDEIRSLGGKVTELRKLKGRVFFKGSESLVSKLNLWASTIERIMIILERTNVSSLDDIYRSTISQDFSFVGRKSFAVRANRVGSHGFTSMDIAKIIGQAVIDSYFRSKGKRLRVDLDNPSVIIRADLVESEFILSIDTTGEEALHKRWWRVYDHPAHLHANLANALLMLSGWKEKLSLLDPMCGSGTIPIEAALRAKGIPPNAKRRFAFQNFMEIEIEEYKTFECDPRIEGSDISRKHIEGAKLNAKSADVAKYVSFREADAQRRDYDFDRVIINLPYGIRMGSKRKIEKLYEGFLKCFSKTSRSDTILAALTSEHQVFERLAKASGLNVFHQRTIKYGGLLVFAFLAK